MEKRADSGSVTENCTAWGGKLGTGMASIRVLVAEDFLPFRRLICATLGKKTGLEIVAEVSDGQEALRKAEELKPDLILLDIGLPTLNGIAAARQIRRLVPDSKIIFVTQESSEDVVQEALRTGALGYVVKTTMNGSLLAAVSAVLDGKQFVSKDLVHSGSV